ncbi:MAG: hypothetical protein WCC53_13705 [Thermoanaerobaculia bacterium]
MTEDVFAAFADVVGALALAVPAMRAPARLKFRLDARLAEFRAEREAAFHLVSRPADLVPSAILAPPGRKRGHATPSPLGRFFLDRRERRAAFFCWYLAPGVRYRLRFTAGRRTFSGPGFTADFTGDGELPVVPLPRGAEKMSTVALVEAATGRTVLRAAVA